jgi:hypothetical protein
VLNLSRMDSLRSRWTEGGYDLALHRYARLMLVGCDKFSAEAKKVTGDVKVMTSEELDSYKGELVETLLHGVYVSV